MVPVQSKGQESPREEMAHRFAEGTPLLTAATAMAIQQSRELHADAVSRLRDGHRWQAESLGMTASDPAKENDMGALIVTGDIYGQNAAEIVRSLQGAANGQPVPQPTPPPTIPISSPARPSALSKLAGPALVAASLLSGTLAGGGVAMLLQKSSPLAAPRTVIVEDDQRLGIEVVPGGADRKTNKE